MSTPYLPRRDRGRAERPILCVSERLTVWQNGITVEGVGSIPSSLKPSSIGSGVDSLNAGLSSTNAEWSHTVSQSLKKQQAFIIYDTLTAGEELCVSGQIVFGCTQYIISSFHLKGNTFLSPASQYINILQYGLHEEGNCTWYDYKIKNNIL